MEREGFGMRTRQEAGLRERKKLLVHGSSGSKEKGSHKGVSCSSTTSQQCLMERCQCQVERLLEVGVIAPVSGTHLGSVLHDALVGWLMRWKR